MLKYTVESELQILGHDPETELPIESTSYFAVATDETGQKWRHTTSFASKFEVVNEVGEIVYQTNTEARQEAKNVVDQFQALGLGAVSSHEEWSEL